MIKHDAMIMHKEEMAARGAEAGRVSARLRPRRARPKRQTHRQHDAFVARAERSQLGEASAPRRQGPT